MVYPAVKLSFSQILFQSNSCFLVINLGMFQCSVQNFCLKIVRNEGKSVRKINVRNFLQVM